MRKIWFILGICTLFSVGCNITKDNSTNYQPPPNSLAYVGTWRSDCSAALGLWQIQQDTLTETTWQTTLEIYNDANCTLLHGTQVEPSYSLTDSGTKTLDTGETVHVLTQSDTNGYTKNQIVYVNNGILYQGDLNGTLDTFGFPNQLASLAFASVTPIPANPGTWAQEAYVKASNANSLDRFGWALSLSGDTLAVGVIMEDSAQFTITNGTGSSADNSLADSGAVYIYRRSGTTWTQEAYIKASNPGSTDYFGYAISLSADTLAVSALQEDSNQNTITNGSTASADNTNTDSGAVYIYQRTGTTWAQQAYIKAENNMALETLDNFGYSLSLSGDTLAVGSVGEDSNQITITNTASADNSSTDSGAVYIYQRTGSTWALEAYVKASNNAWGTWFGTGTALSSNTLAVGSSYEASNQNWITNGPTSSADQSLSNAGAVYIYQRDNGTWSQQAYIKPSNMISSFLFGEVLDLSGSTLAVGVFNERSNQNFITNGPTASADTSLALAGAVYVFQRSGTTWAQQAYIKASNVDLADKFGSSVSVDGDLLAVGAFLEDSNQNSITNTANTDNSLSGSGAVYVYQRSNQNWALQSYIKAVDVAAGDQFGYTVSLSGDTLAVSADVEDANQTTINNNGTGNPDVTLTDSGAVYIYRYQ